jgi:hypothetical protein
MIRTFGPQTLTGNAQPLMSDVTTAAVIVPPDGLDAYITVANNAIYQAGDRIVLEPGTANQDTYKVVAFRTAAGVTSTTVMQCNLEYATGHAHASGVTIQLAINAIDVVVSPVEGGAAAVVIGADNTVTATPGGSAIYRLDKTAAGTEPNVWHMAGGVDHDIVNTADAWMIGTAADKVFAYALVL